MGYFLEKKEFLFKLAFSCAFVKKSGKVLENCQNHQHYNYLGFSLFSLIFLDTLTKGDINSGNFYEKIQKYVEKYCEKCCDHCAKICKSVTCFSSFSISNSGDF